MAGRGPQTFQKRQKEQQRKEKQQEKLAKRLQRKQESRTSDDAPLTEDGADTTEMKGSAGPL
jgi:hypothetical protein